MHPTLELLPLTAETSFQCREFSGPELNCPIHLHPEIEILHVVRGSGEWIIGNHIGTMKTGRIALLGPDLPHALKMTAGRRDKDDAPPCIRVVQFRRDCFGPELFEIPELRAIRTLLERALRGLEFAASAAVEATLLQLVQAAPPHRPALLLALLGALADLPGTPLTSPGYLSTFRPGHSERLDRIQRLVLEHFGNPALNQEEAARRLAISPSALSRFFKRRTGKDFSRFLTEVRIGQACRMLEETETSILEISAACGFANLSNFNRRFRQIKNTTPRTYRRQRRSS